MAGRRKRLLMTADAVGGVWQYSLDLAQALAPLGYDTRLAVMGPSPDAAQRAMAQAVPGLRLIDVAGELDWLAAGPEAVRGAGRAVADLAAREEVDLVQLNSPALLSAGRYFVPTIAVMHSCVASWWAAVRGTALPADMAWRTALVAEGLGRADAVVTPTAAYAAVIRRLYGVEAQAVHNGRYLTLPPRRAMHDCAFTAGRLWDAGKNIAVLDKAAARLGFPFLTAGPTVGPHGEAIELSHLHGLGRLDDAAIANRLASRPIFVSAARYEPFGLAVLEAAAAGCALVLSDIPTFRELWDGAALFIDPDDSRAFARAIEDIVGDPPQRMRLGERARLRAERYTPQAAARAMASLYATLSAPAPRLQAGRVAA